MKKKLLTVIILVAGKGKRMFTSLPKVMHKIAGKSLVHHILDTVSLLDLNCIYLIYNQKIEISKKYSKNHKIYWIKQENQKGTGHAVQQILSRLKDEEDILILYGDVPLISITTIRRLLKIYPIDGIGLVTVYLDDPNGYGRIVRNNDGQVCGIVEQKDADDEQKKIKEINTGTIILRGKNLKVWIREIDSKNVQDEFYLTDIIRSAWNTGHKICTIQPSNSHETIGVNNLLQLSKLERLFQIEQANQLLLKGVHIVDPSRFDLRGELYHGKDVFIDINVILEGEIQLGNRVVIGAGCLLKDSIIEDDVIISPYTKIEKSLLASNSKVGPFSHLRPNNNLGKGVQIGNFVEMKEVLVGENSKIGHFSYLGDAKIGKEVNIGAGTVICNYDGRKKHRTVIEDGVFIGSGSQLVSPLLIGKNSVIGAGTTVTKDVLDGETVLSRVRQFSISHKKKIEEK